MITKRLGELLIEQGHISQEQLDEALEMQKMFPDQTVGQLLCRLGYIRESDLSLVLDQKNKRRKLADILLKEGVIDQQKLSQARELSRQNDIPLERALLKLRFIDEEQLARSVATQYDLPYVEIHSISLDPGLARFISSVYAQKHMLVPISMIGNTLTLAMSQPLRHHDIRQLEDNIRLKIISVIASEASVLRALKMLYRVDLSSSSSALDEVNLDLVPDSISELLNKTSAIDEPEVEEEVRKVTEKDSVIVKLVNKIIYDAYMKKASDIHIEPYPGKRDVTVRIRIDGQCLVYQKIPYKYKFAIPSRIKIMADLDIADRRRPQDGKIDFKKFGPLDIELRVATMPTVGQLEDVVIRILTSGEPISFNQLGLTERNQQVFERCLQSPYGLVLVVGPTGSGKTTTLHSGLAMINSSNRKIWTAEDPVEITQIGLRQVQINPKIGFTFASALRSFLRLDPDVIMVGEMRDEETAGIAVEASLTGHLVFSTLHTNSAPETVSRLLEIGLDPYSFSDSLLCVLAQRLARRLCSHCRETYVPTQTELDELLEEYGRDAFALTGIDQKNITMARAHGCEQCGQSGYHGRLGIHEVLDATDHLKYLIKRRADTDDIRLQAIQDGMTSLKQDGILKVLQGLTDIHEVRRVCIK
ncbi:Flp pilus assembly complex ATPase component TadA [Trichlorobacter lovleyi]|uniref:GspE/PulE family protein n=1 Tax=Trichlorobacter lovleyi TaxID=313985 RepID=UPI00223EDA21|nr:ATPase, T2SS/T4P/T4SS family [Trichlorobacter lovleyi]QOX78675.1 Flp pilus assembly complex ATPase component TadA [Trichlorobacter lovleyi]